MGSISGRQIRIRRSETQVHGTLLGKRWPRKRPPREMASAKGQFAPAVEGCRTRYFYRANPEGARSYFEIAPGSPVLREHHYGRRCGTSQTRPRGIIEDPKGTPGRN